MGRTPRIGGAEEIALSQREIICVMSSTFPVSSKRCCNANALLIASTTACTLETLEASIGPDPKATLEAINGSINESRSRQSHAPNVKVILISRGLSSSTDENTCSAGVSTDTAILSACRKGKRLSWAYLPLHMSWRRFRLQ